MLGPVAKRRLIHTLLRVSLVALLALSMADHARGSRNDWAKFDRQSAKVIDVIDGQTIIAQTGNDRPQRVRLVGIAAPAMVDPVTSHPALYANESRNYITGRINGRTISLTLEPLQTRDEAGDLLAYVYVNDGDCLNADAVRDGVVFADRRARYSYRPQFEQAEGEARRKQRGMWKQMTEEQMPAWRRAWLHRRDE